MKVVREGKEAASVEVKTASWGRYTHPDKGIFKFAVLAKDLLDAGDA
jgi:hypothetical protein